VLIPEVVPLVVPDVVPVSASDPLVVPVPVLAVVPGLHAGKTHKPIIEVAKKPLITVF
jgi:hypothetical protein